MCVSFVRSYVRTHVRSTYVHSTYVHMCVRTHTQRTYVRTYVCMFWLCWPTTGSQGDGVTGRWGHREMGSQGDGVTGRWGHKEMGSRLPAGRRPRSLSRYVIRGTVINIIQQTEVLLTKWVWITRATAPYNTGNHLLPDICSIGQVYFT